MDEYDPSGHGWLHLLPSSSRSTALILPEAVGERAGHQVVQGAGHCPHVTASGQ